MEAFICTSSINDNFIVGKIYYLQYKGDWPWFKSEKVVYHAHPKKLMSAKFESVLSSYLKEAEKCQ